MLTLFIVNNDHNDDDMSLMILIFYCLKFFCSVSLSILFNNISKLYYKKKRIIIKLKFSCTC